MGKSQSFPYIGLDPLLALRFGRGQDYRQRIPWHFLCLIVFLGVSLPEIFSTPIGVNTYSSFMPNHFALMIVDRVFLVQTSLFPRHPPNKVFKDLLSYVPTGEGSKRAAKDKGKSVPWTPMPPKRVEPLAVVPPSPVGLNLGH